jgi:putative transcriptional regulator
MASSKFWNQKLKELGGEYLIWSNAPVNPVLN